VLWSVLVEADGDRAVTREEVVELADAVAAASGIASGIGTSRYGARLLVQADTPDQATARAREEFVRAAATAGLPAWPIVTLTATSEASEDDDESSGPPG
jgi:hypothetical protein